LFVCFFFNESDKYLILVTGGAGFIGSNFVLNWLNNPKCNEEIVVLDALTYAANPENFKNVKNQKFFHFVNQNIRNKEEIKKILQKFKPRAIIHFAAESHVDRSINSPTDFIETNVVGTFNLLDCSTEYYRSMNNKTTEINGSSSENFRFIHISTDEVFGSLTTDDPPFTENSPYRPNSPYAASKASSDHLVRAWNKTYNLPTIISNCSNNYGPYQFPEKLIPLVIYNAINGKKIPIYGNGKQIRDWLYVEDHCKAISHILRFGKIGQTYNIGGESECENLQLVKTICKILDELVPKKNRNTTHKHEELIEFVKDRPGHDQRYGINSHKICSSLNWKPSENLSSGLFKTVSWYLKNIQWINSVKNKSYEEWIKTNYEKR